MTCGVRNFQTAGSWYVQLLGVAAGAQLIWASSIELSLTFVLVVIPSLVSTQSEARDGDVEKLLQLSPIHAHHEAKKGSLDKLRILAALDSTRLHEVNDKGWQPIHEAAQAGHLDVVKFLLENGADIDSLVRCDLALLRESIGSSSIELSLIDILLYSFSCLRLGPAMVFWKSCISCLQFMLRTRPKLVV
jgi:hypothetical protein